MLIYYPICRIQVRNTSTSIGLTSNFHMCIMWIYEEIEGKTNEEMYLKLKGVGNELTSYKN